MAFWEIYRNLIWICQIFLVQVRHCSALVSKNFCFVIVFMFLSVFELRHTSSLEFFLLLWFAKIDALSITHVESRFNRLCLVSSCHGSMVPRWRIMSNFSGTKRIGTFPKHNLNSELSIFAYLNWLWPRNVEKNDLLSTIGKYYLVLMYNLSM